MMVITMLLATFEEKTLSILLHAMLVTHLKIKSMSIHFTVLTNVAIIFSASRLPQTMEIFRVQRVYQNFTFLLAFGIFSTLEKY